MRHRILAGAASSSTHAGPEGSAFSIGVNCCGVARAGRAAVLVDGAAYFRHLETALRRARRSIFIIGWDFDGRIRLRQDESAAASPPLGALLRSLVEAHDELEVHILVWSVSVLHGPSAVAPALLGSPWEDHPRIHMKLDTRHPFYGAHHQKIVCIDGKLAFVGGVDLTVRRWDRSGHLAEDPERVDLDGSPYPPVHDIQMLVDGEAAGALCTMAMERWRRASGHPPPGLERTEAEEGDPWPPELRPDFRDVPVAIARTEPRYGGLPEIAEAGALTLDMIGAAKRAIYIEAQYLTARVIGDALARRLAETDGPDVVIVMTHESRGLIERFAMAANRDRLIRRLVRADRGGRLRVLYPVVPCREGETQVLVHSKLVIVDDTLLRIGSSNLNNRSIGLDTECDLAIEARTGTERRAIAAIRDRLLAEHLDCEPQALAQVLAEGGGLSAAVDRLNIRARGLRPFAATKGKGPSRPVFATALLDPVRPFRLPPLRLPWPFGRS